MLGSFEQPVDRALAERPSSACLARKAATSQPANNAQGDLGSGVLAAVRPTAGPETLHTVLSWPMENARPGRLIGEEWGQVLQCSSHRATATSVFEATPCKPRGPERAKGGRP